MNKQDEELLLTEVKKILEHYFSEELGEGASDDIAEEILAKANRLGWMSPSECEECQAQTEYKISEAKKQERERISDKVRHLVNCYVRNEASNHDTYTCVFPIEIFKRLENIGQALKGEA